MTPDALLRLLSKFKPPKVALVAEIRVHPATLALIREQIEDKLKAAGESTTFLGLRIIADDTVGRGWLHEHDGQGNLLRRVPPIGEQRRVSN